MAAGNPRTNPQRHNCKPIVQRCPFGIICLDQNDIDVIDEVGELRGRDAAFELERERRVELRNVRRRDGIVSLDSERNGGESATLERPFQCASGPSHLTISLGLSFPTRPAGAVPNAESLAGGPV